MNEQQLPDILDVEPPVAIPADPIHWSLWLGAVLILLLLVALVWWLRNRRQSVGITPKERALTRLEALHSETSAMNGYQFGVAVSDTLRTYLTEAHGLRVNSLTNCNEKDGSTKSAKSGWASFSRPAISSNTRLWVGLRNLIANC